MTTHPPVMGIDTNSFGFHVVSTEPVPMPDAPPAFIGWHVSAEKDAQARRRSIYSAANEFFLQLPRATSVFVEEPLVLPKNIETTRKLVMVGGVIEAAFMQACPDATLFWVDVATWRKSILGVGSGAKDKLKQMAMDRVQRGWDSDQLRDLGAVFESQPDLYDAACICMYGQQALYHGEVRMR